MGKIVFYLALGLLTLFQGCYNDEHISTDDQNLITKEVKDRLDGYGEAIKRKDSEWIEQFWSNEKDFVMAGDGKIETNFDSVMTKEYREAFKTIKEMKYLNFSNGKALVLSRNAVSYVTNFNWQAIMVSGDTVNASGSWLFLFRKSDDKWKVVHSAGTHNYTE